MISLPRGADREPVGRGACRFLVTGRGFAESEHPTEALAVSRARAVGGDASVVCVTEIGRYRTRQAVWPHVGPVYAEAAFPG